MHTLKFDINMEITKEKIYELGKEKIVTDLVNEILSNDPLDNTIVTEVILDDNGYCIHITFSGGVNASTLIAISEAFGDDDPNVYGDGENSINIVFSNNKYDCLIDNE